MYITLEMSLWLLEIMNICECCHIVRDDKHVLSPIWCQDWPSSHSGRFESGAGQLKLDLHSEQQKFITKCVFI